MRRQYRPDCRKLLAIPHPWQVLPPQSDDCLLLWNMLNWSCSTRTLTVGLAFVHDTSMAAAAFTLALYCAS